MHNVIGFMLEPGEVKSLTEIAKREGVDTSYVSRMANLTTLAPDIVAAILDDRLPDHVTLLELAADPPVLWGGQWRRITPHLYVVTDHYSEVA
jgi:hypothetical protein